MGDLSQYCASFVSRTEPFQILVRTIPEQLARLHGLITKSSSPFSVVSA